MDKLFVIAIGGTGMRCLESFTHLCGIGMFDNQEIEVLTLDTDQNNGNKGRVEELINLYSRIKTSGSIEGGTPNANTFFSAKLNLHRFWTNYSSPGRENYKNITKLSTGTAEQQKANKLISDLFLDKSSVQEFALEHGYRAQTHLGSMLIYHGIVEAARNIIKGSSVESQERELDTFIGKLEQAGASSRVFIFGSVFGGTGASSIPVIPKALQDFVKIRSGGNASLDFSKAKFGSTLLTEYFTFNKPDDKQKSSKANSVIADSSFFSLNSQAALQFYQSDPTVQKCYKLLYHIGWPIESKKIDEKNTTNHIITGGTDQKNPCHVTELLCACAAYDFFSRTDGFDSVKAEYLYKAVEFKDNSFNFSFDDFVGNANKAGELFVNRLGAFFSLAHISLTKNGAAFDDTGIKGFITQCENQKLLQYSTITDAECKDINEYFKLFAYTFKGTQLIPGWLYQVRNSVAPGKFLFDSKAFLDSQAELKKLDVGTIFLDEKHHWSKGGFFGDRYSTFVEKLINTNPKDEQKVNTTKEKFLAHIFNALTISQNFDLN
ncbi:hypothetical protein AQ505_08450 [Pedobacter sp. PACM 27299]|uniref:hypothetical protein n=1 Tax=Pedobacter sp. PACM 27299 TaxID=1727164 RepID=UPI000706F034|nr:hypothetical protein [Pedobacter sp. PACM 27299]ALL05516.1 hypothetical protein AQ505_08450 [Pedobacter sp. PACM 27299]